MNNQASMPIPVILDGTAKVVVSTQIEIDIHVWEKLCIMLDSPKIPGYESLNEWLNDSIYEEIREDWQNSKSILGFEGTGVKDPILRDKLVEPYAEISKSD